MRKIVIRILIGLSVVFNLFFLYALVMFNDEINNMNKHITELTSYCEASINVIDGVLNDKEYSNKVLEKYKSLRLDVLSNLDDKLSVKSISLMQAIIERDRTIYEYEISLDNNLIEQGFLQEPYYMSNRIKNFTDDFEKLSKYNSILE